MKKIELKTRKLLRAIFGGLSLTAVAFIFQACYGTGPDHCYDIKLTGTVKSKTTNLPIKGIQVTVVGCGYNYNFTDENGNFDFYTSVPNEWAYNDSDSVYVHFLDIDSTENGFFADKTIVIRPAHKDEIKINVKLDDKE